MWTHYAIWVCLYLRTICSTIYLLFYCLLAISPWPTPTWSKTVLSFFSHLKTTNKVKQKPWNVILYICGMHAINTGSYGSKGDSLINVQSCTICIKHSLKDLRRNNPGTLSPPSLHKWEMLSNSNLQTGDLRSQTTHTHTHRAAKTHQRQGVHTHAQRLIHHHTGFTLSWGCLRFIFSKPCCFNTTSQILKWYEIFRFWCVKGVTYFYLFTVIHHRSHIITTVGGFLV